MEVAMHRVHSIPVILAILAVMGTVAALPFLF